MLHIFDVLCKPHPGNDAAVVLANIRIRNELQRVKQVSANHREHVLTVECTKDDADVIAQMNENVVSVTPR